MLSLLQFTFIALISLNFATELSYVDSHKREKVPRKAYQKSVWFFYTTDCSVCHQQVIELECLKKPISVVAAGYGAKRMKLWRESKKLKLTSLKPFRSYFIDDTTLKTLPLKKGLSPQLILFENEKPIKHFIGLTSCSKVIKEFTSSKRKS